MRFLHAPLLSLLAFVLPACGSSAVTATVPAWPPEGLPEARVIVDHFLAASKYDVVRRSNSRKESGTLELPVGTGRFENYARRPDAIRAVMHLGGGLGDFENGVTGAQGWAVLPGNTAALLEGTELLQARIDAAYDGLEKPERLYESLRTLERTTFDGVACFKLEVIARNADGLEPEETRRARTTFEYYELESGLLRGQEGFADGELSKGPYTKLLHDYRELAGTLVPTRLVQRMDANEVVARLETLEFDTVQDADLKPPRAIERQLEVLAEEDDEQR